MQRVECELVADFRHLRSVVEHAIDRIADALVVQRRHRQPRQAGKEPSAQGVGQALGEADVDQVLGDSPKATSRTAAGTDLVLALGGGVGAAKETKLLERTSARAEHDQEDEQQDRKHQHDLHRCHAVQERNDGRHERWIGNVGIAKWPLKQHIVGGDLAEPRQQHGGAHEAETEQQLGREQAARLGEQPRRAQHQRGRLARGNRGIEVDAVVEAQAAPARLAPVFGGGRSGIPDVGHPAASRPMVSASTKPR